MIFGNLVIEGFQNNDCFNPDARDNCCQPFISLRNELKKHDIEINTSDLNQDNVVSFEIHVDEHISNYPNIPKFLFLWESPNVVRRNSSLNKDHYYKIFTWDDDLINSNGYTKFYIPVAINILNEVPNFRDREGFSCAIWTNKYQVIKNENDLYGERRKLNKWFEKNAPQDFDLYGKGWEDLIFNKSLAGNLFNILLSKAGIKDQTLRNVYKGTSDSKLATLQKYKYSFCYENIHGFDGYVSEKIFDSMFAGCVPIYWGAGNISSYIPDECFIDRRKFNSNKNIYDYLKSIDDRTYARYQQAISSFLTSEDFQKYTPKYFAENITYEIIGGLNDYS